MSDERPSLEELKTAWRKRVQEAELQLEIARRDVKRLEEELRWQSIPSPDLHYSYQRALRAGTQALEKYANVVTILHDLTVRGTIPKEESDKT